VKVLINQPAIILYEVQSNVETGEDSIVNSSSSQAGLRDSAQQRQRFSVAAGVKKLPSSTTTTAIMSQRQQQPGESSSSHSAAVSARIISGSVGSLITALAVTPLEVVKVHLQNNPIAPNNGCSTVAASAVPRHVSLCPKGCGTFVLNNGLFDCVLPKSSVPYFDHYGNLKDCELSSAKNYSHHKRSGANRGTFSMIRKIFVTDGCRGIYAGLAPTLVMGIPSTVLYYTTYDELVAQSRKHKHLLPAAVDPFWIPLLAGSSARLLSTLATAPLELIRTRQASMVGEGLVGRGMVAEFKTIVQHDGCAALYKGLGPTLWRDVPFSGIYWLCLEQFRQFYAPLLMPDHNQQSASTLQLASLSFLSGASAGMVAAASTTVRFLHDNSASSLLFRYLWFVFFLI